MSKQRIQDSYEYKLIKRLTAEENRKEIRKVVLLGSAMFIIGYAFLILLLNLMVWLWTL